MASTGSRRRWLGLLAGLLAGGRDASTAAGEGIAIADAGGGDENVGSQTTRVRVARPDAPPPCQPIPVGTRCDGICNVSVSDGCGGRIPCTCPPGQGCGADDTCCPLPQLCEGASVYCAADLVARLETSRAARRSGSAPLKALTMRAVKGLPSATTASVLSSRGTLLLAWAIAAHAFTIEVAGYGRSPNNSVPGRRKWRAASSLTSSPIPGWSVRTTWPF